MKLPFAIQQETEPVLLPIWNETLAGIEAFLLRTSPVYWGYNIPKGDGSAVVVTPGFLGTDLYLGEMRNWLSRIGYKPYSSGIGWNADCPRVIMDRLKLTVDRAHKETGRPAHLIGHSLGGIISRSYAVWQPESIKSVITMGSPFRGPRAHPMVLNAIEMVKKKIHAEHGSKVDKDCFSGYCGCGFVAGLQSLFPETVRQTCIYTCADGIVDWEFCRSGERDVDVEVSASHVGLAFNPAVYEVIAQRLAV